MQDIELFGDESSSAVLKRRKRFTLDQAERTLPLVKRVVADVVRVHAQASRLHAMLERIRDREQREQIEDELDTTVRRLEQLVDELTDIGCELRDYKRGIVDFVSTHQGRNIYLCWQLGQDRITGWQEIDVTTDAGKPIALLI